MSTAVSGTGPAYVFMVIEALIDAAVPLGFPRHIAHDLVIEALLGGTLLAQETAMQPAYLRNIVTSPPGASAAAVAEIEHEPLAREYLSKAYRSSATASSFRGWRKRPPGRRAPRGFGHRHSSSACSSPSRARAPMRRTVHGSASRDLCVQAPFTMPAGKLCEPGATAHYAGHDCTSRAPFVSLAGSSHKGHPPAVLRRHAMPRQDLVGHSDVGFMPGGHRPRARSADVSAVA